MIKLKAGSTWKEINKPLVKANNQWQEVRNGFIKVAGKWRIFWKYIIENPVDTTLLDVDLFKLFGSPKNPYEFVFINNGIIGSQENTQSLLIKDFAIGSKITVINNGKIIGNGGNGGVILASESINGTDGANAISLHSPTTIINSIGAMIAGGGGGGAGATGWYQAVVRCTGGGGAGNVAGLGGENTRNGVVSSITPDGSEQTGAIAPVVNVDYVNGYLTVWAGNGGDLGKDGTVGGSYRCSSNHTLSGKGGKAINDNLTNSILINNGTLYGTNDLET